MNKIDPDKEIEDITRLTEESERLISERERRKKLKEQRRKESEPSMIPAILSFIVIIASVYGLFQIYEKVNTRKTTVQIASFQNESSCKLFVNKNTDFSKVNCSLAKKQAQMRSKSTNGGMIYLNGSEGNKCYRIDQISGFAVVVGKNKSLFHTLPLYYTRNIDIKSSILSFPDGSPASINHKIDIEQLEAVKLAKRSVKCF